MWLGLASRLSCALAGISVIHFLSKPSQLEGSEFCAQCLMYSNFVQEFSQCPNEVVLIRQCLSGVPPGFLNIGNLLEIGICFYSLGWWLAMMRARKSLWASCRD